MLGIPPSRVRQRYRTVATVLGAHGMGALASRLGLDRFSPARLFGRTPGPPHTTAEHVRMALEELGTTAIKLGQVLSTRPDLLPEDYIAELEKLRDRVARVPADDIIAIIERELPGGLAAAFASFDGEPLASASIGQVHGATMHDGTAVVVKVRKPGVLEQASVDLDVLLDLGKRANRAGVLDGAYDFEGLASEFGWTLRAELDYVREGRNADRLRAVLTDEPRAIVPRIHWDITTESVLVMDRVDGIPIDDVERLTASGIDCMALARANAEILMRQVFVAGFFHGDPHPGNFLVVPDGRIAILDFGMVGQLDDELRFTFLRFLAAVVDQDAAGIVDQLEHLGILRSPSDREAVRRDIHHVLERYYGLADDEFRLTDYINDVLRVVQRYRLQLPAELALLLKTVGISEGLWRKLDPAFNAASIAEPYVQQAASEVYAPRAWGRRMVRAAGDTVELGAYLPGQIRRIAARIDRGDFEVTLRHRDIDEILSKLSNMVTRMSVAIVAAAVIVGLPLLATTWEPPAWEFIAPGMFVVGLLIVIVLLARLAFGRR
jgi:ubiquinone biosynthesis protein